MRFLMLVQAIVLAVRRFLFGTAGSPAGLGLPPLIDEVEAFEDRLGSVLPGTWSLERVDRRPWDPLSRGRSLPYLSDLDRSWVLSTPWPGEAPQRAQVHLFLIMDGAPIPASKDVLTRWERFTVVAQDPTVIQIANRAFTWDTLPDWPDARAEIIGALA
jgi:hypothetical protein